MKQVEVAAKRLENAIEEGLKQLGATMDDVDIEILEQGGIFRKAKVRLTLVSQEEPVLSRQERKPDEQAAGAMEKPAIEAPAANVERKEKPVREKKEKPVRDKKHDRAEKTDRVQEKRQETVERAPIAGNRPDLSERRPLPPVEQHVLDAVQAYLDTILPFMEIEGGASVTDENGVIRADLATTDSAAIGHRGEVLDSLQVLLKRVAENAGGGRHAAITVDCQNYRMRREQSLVALAKRQADKCVRTGRKVVLDPMASSQRKIVHAALNEDERIITRSEGRDPNRRVVILPKR